MSTQSFLPSYNHRLVISLLLFVSLISCTSNNLNELTSNSRVNSISFNVINQSGMSAHYAFAGDEQSDVGVLFIHGSPGDWSAFSEYLQNKELLKDYFIVSVDRLGWGLSRSSIERHNGLESEFDFDRQAELIRLIMQYYPNKQWVIVGHSLGASIAPRLALKEPASVSALLLLSGSLDPNLGKPRWYNLIANSSLFNWLIPKKLQQSNHEIMSLQAQLQALQSDLSNTALKSDLIVIQGMKDKLVSPKNTEFVKQNWQNHFDSISVIELKGEGHFLPWRQSALIVENIKQLGTD